MSIRKIRCKHCKTIFKVRFNGSGEKKVKCPGCDERMIVGRGTASQDQASRRNVEEEEDYEWNLPKMPRVRSSSAKNKQNSTEKKPWMWVGILGAVACLIVIVALMLSFSFLSGNRDPQQLANNNPDINNSSEANKSDKIGTDSGYKAESLSNSGPVETVKVNENWKTAGIDPKNMFSSSEKDIVSKPPRILFNWKEKSEYSYKFLLTATIDQQERILTGICTYKVGPERNSRSFGNIEIIQKETKGNGTGFVVDPNGYIVTCSHVIKGATKIEATVNDKKYRARVLAVHPSEDLAIIQIEGSEFPTVPITNSDSVELAEDVRVIGYPLASVLGSGVKVTTGSVSGILDVNKSKRFQLDAAVNPGNSGGPAFNEAGEVIGVTDAKLAHRDVSSVAFAIPINIVEDFLKQHHVRYQKTNRSDELPGTELVKQVKPAVAYIEVTSGKKQQGKSIEVSYSSVVTTQAPLSRSRLIAPIMIPRSESESGKFLISEYGDVHAFTGQKKFPFFFGPVGLVAVESLPKEDQSEWKNENMFTDGGFAGVSTSQYKIIDETSQQVSLNKTHTIRSLDDPKNPAVKVSSESTILFDKELGMPSELNLKGEFTKREGNLLVRIPIKFNFKLRSKEEIEKSRADFKKKMAEYKRKEEKRKAPLTSAEQKLVLADLKSRNVPKINAALKTIIPKKPTIPNNDIGRIIFLLLNHKEYQVRYNARRAIEVWAAPDNITQISKLVRDRKTDSSLRRSLIIALGSTRSTKAVKTLVDLLYDSSTKYQAKDALVALGSPAEDEIIKLLSHHINDIRNAACEILGKMGTSKSVPHLTKMVEEQGTDSLGYRAKSALRKINERLNRSDQ